MATLEGYKGVPCSHQGMQALSHERMESDQSKLRPPSMRALLPEATLIVKNSSIITTSELGKPPKATISCGDIVVVH